MRRTASSSALFVAVRPLCSEIAANLAVPDERASQARLSALQRLSQLLRRHATAARAADLCELLEYVLFPLQCVVDPPDWWIQAAIAAVGVPQDGTGSGGAGAAAAPSARRHAAWVAEAELFVAFHGQLETRLIRHADVPLFDAINNIL